MIADIDDFRRIVYQKKSFYERNLFLVDSKKFYNCVDLTIQSEKSTADVLNYNATLIIDEKSYQVFIEIPSVLTNGAEDFIILESNDPVSSQLICREVSSDKFDKAFVETVGARMSGFPIFLKDSLENKKSEEAAGIWGPGWKAKRVIDRERNNYLRTLKNCSGVKALSEVIIRTQKELNLIK
jgi:hypothetical protein